MGLNWFETRSVKVVINDEIPSALTDLLLKAGIALLVANEVRGLVLAAPVLYGMFEAGGTPMALWLGACSLAGIALSVVAPLFVAKKLKLIPLKAVERGHLCG